MEEYKSKDNSFLVGLSITLGTIVIGLVSYIVFTTDFKDEKLRCEYNGWAYAHEEAFDSIDGCNVCSCNNGSVVCTQMACEKLP
jgi:hypothetical protein